MARTILNIAWCDSSQLACKVSSPGIEQILAMQAYLVELRFYSGNHLRVTVTDVEDTVAAEAVQVALAVCVIGVNATISELDCAFRAAKLVGEVWVQVIDGIFERTSGNLFVVTGATIDNRKSLNGGVFLIQSHKNLPETGSQAVLATAFGVCNSGESLLELSLLCLL